MNKRVRKLAKQAGFGLYSDGEIYTAKLEHLPITENMEKFAELIIRECAWAADFAENTSPGDYVKKHFGVE